MMNMEAFAATFTILTLTLFMGVSAQDYVLQPDCSAIQSQPCTTIPMLDANNQISYSEYEESCPYHTCAAIQPVYPPVASNASSYSMSMIHNQRWPNDFPRDTTHGQNRHEDAKSWAAFTGRKDSSEKVAFNISYDALAPWFCSVANISYNARVEANTGYPPGKKEDMRAQCEYQQLLDSQSLGDCRHIRYTCIDCANFYRNWVCAMAFPRCYPNMTVTTYPVYNASNGVNGLVPTKIFGILKPCRGLCWGVIQRCQQYTTFSCPLTDTRDYGDYPNCNALGFDQGATPYAKSIYW